MTRTFVGVVVAGVLVTAASSMAVQSGTGTVYVSATAKNGSVVTDLSAAEFEVKAGGKKQAVVSAQPATTPLRIALIVADGGTGAFQLGLARFIQKLVGHAEFALISVILQPETLVDYSTDAGRLIAGVQRLGRRHREQGAQLMEAIQDVSKEIRREAKRPVIVVMRIGGEAATPVSGNDVRAELRKSGAILYAISTVGAQRPAPSQARGTDAVSVQQGQLRDAEVAEGAFHLAQVLGDGARESGGRHDEIVSTTLVTALEQVADELRHQYEITYERGDGVKPGAKLSVSAKRKGVTVHAPLRLPN